MRVAALAATFLLIRIVLLAVREPFFDELFTVWLARRPFGEIVPALLVDSGPPLYYFVARLTDVIALRGLSLVFAFAALILILSRESLGNARYVAALLLAVYPPAALYAVDARAYALCGLLVAIGVVAIHERRPVAAAGALLLAAYTHWYGALFLPFVLLAQPRRRALVALIGASVLFVPGLWLASQQPKAAMAWLGEGQQALNVLAFAGRYAESLFQPAPWALVILSAIALIAAGARSWAFAPLALGPLMLAVAFGFAGRPVYFPMRFESVIAVPLVLWLATSLERWPRRVSLVLTTILCVCGAATIAIGATDHYRRDADPYRAAVRALPPDEPVVATGYLYLEAAYALGDRVRAFPAEQGRHPGWRVEGMPREPLPRGTYLLVAERGAPELTLLGGRRVQVVFANERAVVLRVSN